MTLNYRTPNDRSDTDRYYGIAKAEIEARIGTAGWNQLTHDCSPHLALLLALRDLGETLSL